MTVHAVRLPQGHEISDDKARLDMEFVHRSLADAYWAIGRPRSVTDRSWAHCRCCGVYAPDGAKVGFARVLTDYALHAHIGDVFIHPSSRGLGLGKALVGVILEHPELATVGQWTLTTSDAHGLYVQYGFGVAEADGLWMTLARPAATRAAEALAPSNPDVCSTLNVDAGAGDHADSRTA